MEVAKCIITDYTTIDNKEIGDDFFTYIVSYNNRRFQLKFSSNEDWNSKKTLSDDNKITLKAMLFNGEWPLESETRITPELIGQIMRLGDHPKTFDEKLDYFVLKLYQNGGSEYKSISVEPPNFLYSYSTDVDEFARLRTGGISKNYFSYSAGPSSFLLTEPGIERARVLLAERQKEQPAIIYSAFRRPKIAIYGFKDDKFYYEKARELFLKYGFTVTGSEVDNNTYVDFQSSNYDFILFIHSEQSNRDGNFVSIITSAVEFHNQRPERSSFSFILFGSISAMNHSKVIPILQHYYANDFYDFRIVPNRRRLVQRAMQEWNKRLKASEPSYWEKPHYDFPVIKISEHERKWLQIVYDRFISGTETHYQSIYSKYWNDFPKEFSPQDVNPLLMEMGTYITLYGIWVIDPTSNFITGVNDFILTIKQFLKEQGKPEKITHENIKIRLPQYRIEELKVFAELINRTKGFFTEYIRDDLGFSFKIYSEEFLSRIRNFESIDKTYVDIFSLRFEKEKPKEQSPIEKSDSLNLEHELNIHSFPTDLRYNTKSINPVMGVGELASDMAGLIKTLPNEKGQMIGVFGRWGRGKSFLLEEIWKLLEKDVDTGYLRIDYHAWKYQETPASWAYLYELFADKYLGKKELMNFSYYAKLAWLNFWRLGFLNNFKLFLSIGFSLVIAYIAKVNLSAFRWYYLSGAIAAIIAADLTYIKHLYEKYSTRATALIKKYTHRHSFKDSLGIQADIQEELIKLLKIWIPSPGKKKIILIVEDVDRCNEDKIVPIIDALRVMLEDDAICERVVVITAVDERILQSAIALKYHAMFGDEGEEETLNIKNLVSEYIDKAFLSAIKLGELTATQKNEFLDELMKNDIDASEPLEKKPIPQRSEEEQKLIKELFSYKEGLFEPSEEFVLLKGNKKSFQELSREEVDQLIKSTKFKTIAGKLIIENINGASLSLEEMEWKMKGWVKQQGEIRKLTRKEVSIFKEKVRAWDGATPRQIRILYYRFLLCKNLLVQKYSRSSEVCIWQQEDYVRLLLDEIIRFTELKDASQTSKEKKRVMERMSKEHHYEKRGNLIVGDGDYLKLLEVLELTIAY